MSKNLGKDYYTSTPNFYPKSTLTNDINYTIGKKYRPSNMDYFSTAEYPSQVSEVNLMYRRYISDLESDYSMKYHDLNLKNQRDNKSLSHKAGVYEAMNDGLQTKLRFLSEEANSSEAKVQFLMTENAEMRDCIEKLRAEKDTLMMLLKEHGISLSKYENALQNLQVKDKKLKSEYDFQTLEFWRKLRALREELSLLTAKNERDSANYELMLQDKQRMVDELQDQLMMKDRKLALINTMERELELLRDKYQNDMKANSDLIRKLQFQLEEMSRYKPKNFDPFNELQKARMAKMESNGPIKEVVFENNPYLVEKLDKFRDEMNRAQEAEASAKRNIKGLEDENSRLRSLIDKLRNGLDDFRPDFGQKSRPDNKMITDYVMGVRSDMINNALQFNQEVQSKLVRELCFRILLLNGLLGRMNKKYLRLKQERIDAVRNAKRDNPLFVFGYIRERLVEWLFEIYCRSTDGMAERKANSFLIYKVNMEEIAKTERPFLNLIIPTYIYLYDIVEHEIPKYQLRPIHNIEGFKKKKMKRIGQIIAYNSEFIDVSSEWIEDTLSQVIYRQKNERKKKNLDGERNWGVLFLYRLLTILYRIRYPIKEKPLKIEYALKLYLEIWICRAAVDFFNRKLRPLEQYDKETNHLDEGVVKVEKSKKN